MTDTRKALTNERHSHAEGASDQALAWMARQLRWEHTLATLRAGRKAERRPAAARKAA